MLRVLSLLLLAAVVLAVKPASAQDCVRSVELAEIEGLLKQAEKSIYLVKFDAAVVALDEAELLTPCLGEVVTSATLSKMFLLRGVVAFNQDNELGATHAFRRALAVEPGLQWNERFGQRARATFLDARELVITTPKGRLRLPRAADGVGIHVDGGLTSAEGGEIEVPAGRHLLQVFKGEALLSGQWLEIAGGGLVLPPLPPEAGTMEAPPGPSPRTGSGGASTATWMRPAGMGSAVGGAVLVGTGVVTGVLYLQSKAALENGDYYANRDDAEKDALLQRNKITAIATDVALPVGGILVGTGISLLLMSRGKKTAQADTVVPWFAADGGGLAMTVHF